MKRNLLMSLFLLFAGIVQAQRDFTVNQYMFSGIFTNPGYAGSSRYGNVTLLHRGDFSGVKGAPQAQYLSFSSKAGMANAGFGGLFMNEQSGAGRQISMYGVYAYHLKLNKQADRLSFGIRGGISNTRLNLAEVEVIDPTDPVFQENSSFVNLRAGLGLYYYSKHKYFGMSLPYILDYRINNTGRQYGSFSAWNMTAGYVYKYSERLLLKPTILARYDQTFLASSKKNYDVTAGLNALLMNHIWLGGTFSSIRRMSIITELKINSQLRMGYAYSFNTALTNSSSLNSVHEMMFSWDLNYDLTNMRNPRYF